jgi:hypothetical protein
MGLSGNDFCCPKTAPFSWLKQEKFHRWTGSRTLFHLITSGVCNFPALPRKETMTTSPRNIQQIYVYMVPYIYIWYVYIYIYVEETYSYIYLYIYMYKRKKHFLEEIWRGKSHIFAWRETQISNHRGFMTPCAPCGGAWSTIGLEPRPGAEMWSWWIDSPWIALPSSKHTKNYGKSPFLMSKSTISIWPFSIVVCMFTRG